LVKFNITDIGKTDYMIGFKFKKKKKKKKKKEKKKQKKKKKKKKKKMMIIKSRKIRYGHFKKDLI